MNKTLKVIVLSVAAVFILALSVLAENAGEGEDVAGITQKVYNSVVRLEVGNGRRRIATGVVFDKDGHILTTALLAPRNEKILIISGDGKTSEGEFLGFDPETRLAVVRSKEKNLVPLAAGDIKDLAAGSPVYLIGISPEITPAVTQGIVSSVSDERLRLNICVTPGSSGGPVVDSQGRMVGILRGVYSEDGPGFFEFHYREQGGSDHTLSGGSAFSSGMAVAIPVDVVRNVAQEIIENGKVRRGWIGVSVGMDEKNRAVIADVEPSSPAEQAKLQENDIILKIDDKDISGTRAILSEIRKKKPGDSLTLKVERDGKPLDIKVKLGEFSPENAFMELERTFPRLFRGEKDLPDMPKIPGAPGVFPRHRPGMFGPGLRMFIGVYLTELNKELAQHFGVKEGVGLLVNRVKENGPAEKAGVQVGDIIVKADERRVENAEDLSRIVMEKKKGDKIKLEILRNNKILTIQVPVETEERPERNFAPAMGSLNPEDFMKPGQLRRRPGREGIGEQQEMLEDIGMPAALGNILQGQELPDILTMMVAPGMPSPMMGEDFPPDPSDQPVPLNGPVAPDMPDFEGAVIRI